MEFIEKYKDVAEFVYYLTGPFLLIGLVVAIAQLYVFRKEAVIRFSRETINNSISILERKVKELRDAQDELWEVEKELDFPSYDGELSELSKNGFGESCEWLARLHHDDCMEIVNSATQLCNEIEVFAHYVFSGITDEDMCFDLQGTLFLAYMEDNKHYLAALRENGDDETYKSAVKLYELWSIKNEHNTALKEFSRSYHKLKGQKRPCAKKPIGL